MNTCTHPFLHIDAWLLYIYYVPFVRNWDTNLCVGVASVLVSAPHLREIVTTRVWEVLLLCGWFLCRQVWKSPKNYSRAGDFRPSFLGYYWRPCVYYRPNHVSIIWLPHKPFGPASVQQRKARKTQPRCTQQLNYTYHAYRKYTGSPWVRDTSL